MSGRRRRDRILDYDIVEKSDQRRVKRRVVKKDRGIGMCLSRKKRELGTKDQDEG
jgi:hypothetical protein